MLSASALALRWALSSVKDRLLTQSAARYLPNGLKRGLVPCTQAKGRGA
jgi:hypothetical protein